MKALVCHCILASMLSLPLACASTQQNAAAKNAKTRKAPNDRFRQSAPDVIEVGQQSTRPFEKKVLRNGVTLFAQERAQTMLTHISLVFRDLKEQEAKRGAADVYLTLAEYKLTQSLPWAKISSSRQRDHLRIDLRVDNADALKSIEGLAQLTRFKLDPSEIETAKARVRYQLSQRNKGLRARSAQTRSIEKLVFEEGHLFAEATLSADEVSLLNARDLKRFRQKGLNAKATAIVVISDQNIAKVKSAATRALGKLKSQRRVKAKRQPLGDKEASIVLKPSSESDTALIRLGHVYRDHPLNPLVDDVLKERLKRALASKKLDPYYIESASGEWSYFSLTLEVANDKCAEALYVLADVYEQLRQKNLSENEITLTKRHILQATHMARVIDPALLAVDAFVHQRSAQYFDEVQKQQRAVSPDDFRAHLEKYLSKERWRVHVEGELSIMPALEAIEVAPVELEEST